MARKSSKTKESIELKRKKLEEAANQLKAEQEQLEAEQKAEQDLLKSTEDQINELATANNMFCGVILTPSDLLNVIELAMKTGENIKIPVKVYYNE